MHPPHPLETTYHIFSSLLPIHEALGVHSGGQDLVALTELLEEDAVREAEPADTDALQDSVAAELVEDEGSDDFAGFLLVVGNNAADKVGLGLAQSVHEIVQLLLENWEVKVE